MANCSIFLTI